MPTSASSNIPSPEQIKIGFFGTSEFSTMTLDILRARGYIIDFVVTTPDRPKGRGLTLTAPAVKLWAIENKIPFLQPESLQINPQLESDLKSFSSDVYVVIDYGKIIPESVLNIPKHKSLNIHGSILPKFRGASPLEYAILEDERKTGATIIRMDAEMDHGPILAIREVVAEPWPPTATQLGLMVVEAGSELIAEILPDYISGGLKEIEQDHSKATFTKKISKEDGLLDLNADPYLNYRKYQAYKAWPEVYFMHERGDRKLRIKIKQASFKDGNFVIEKVIPEGKKEMLFSDFEKGYGVVSN